MNNRKMIAGLIGAGRAALLGVSVWGVCACAMGMPQGYVPEIDVHAANYTDDYIHEYHLETIDGGNLHAGGSRIKPFSKGGTGGTECCAALPGVGQRIRIAWKTGDYNDLPSAWSTHVATTIVKGETSDDPDTDNYLIVRFFSHEQVEAEYIAQSIKFGSSRSPRADQLFTGQRVMRHPGE